MVPLLNPSIAHCQLLIQKYFFHWTVEGIFRYYLKHNILCHLTLSPDIVT